MAFSEDIELYIAEASRKHGVDPNLIRAVVRKESGGDPNAVSHKGAGGAMQIMPATFQELGGEDVFDPQENIDLGTKYLGQQLAAVDGDIPAALGRYNAGPGAHSRNAKIYGPDPSQWPEGVYDETRDYTSKIMADYATTEPAGEPFQVAGPPPVQDTPYVSEYSPVVEPEPEPERPEGMRKVYLPDGTHVNVAPKYSDEEALEIARERHPDAFKVDSEETRYAAGDSGPLDAFQSSWYRSLYGLAPGAQAAYYASTSNEEGYDQAQQNIIDVSKRAHEMAPNLVALEDISKTYDDDGLLPATGKALEFATEQIFSSLGYMGPAALAGAVVGGVAGFLSPMIGGTAAGAAMGAKLGGWITRATLGTLAYTGTQFGNYMSSNLERAYSEGQVDTDDVSMAKIVSASAGQAALEAVTARLAGGFKFLSKDEKRQVFSTVGRWLDDLDNTSGVKKALAVMAEEEVAEIGQQALERYAAGLEVSPADEDAAREYAHIALAALAPSAGFGLVGAGTGKWNKNKAQKAKEGRAAVRKEIEATVDANLKIAAEEKGMLIELAGIDSEAELQVVRDKRAEIEAQILKEREDAADIEGVQSKFDTLLRQAQYLEEVEDALAQRNVIEQEIIDGGDPSAKDIHKLAADRNILWDDDAAFMAFTLRLTGKPKIDMLSPEERLKLYRHISNMPRQDVPTKLSITTDDLAIELAKKVRGKGEGEATLRDVKEVLGIRGNDLTKEELEVIAEAYRLRMTRLGLARYDGGGKVNKWIYTGRLPVKKDVYEQIIADTKSRGEFPLQADLEKYGIKTKDAYDKLRAYAVVNRDIALENDLYVPSGEAGVKPRFRLEIDGQSTDQVFASEEAAEAAAENIYDEDNRRRGEAREREDNPVLRGALPQGVRESIPERNIAVVREESNEQGGLVSRYKYNVSKTEGNHAVIRDKSTGEIVRIEKNAKAAKSWIKGRLEGTARFDVVVDGEILSSHKRRSAATEARNAWIESVREKGRQEYIAENQDGWLLGDKALQREATKAGNDAVRRAKDHKRSTVKTVSIPASEYEVNIEKGFVLKESRVRDSGGQGDFRPIGVFESSSEAKDAANKKVRDREGAEVWAGRKLDPKRSRKKVLEAKIKRRRGRAYAEAQVPVPSAPVVEAGPALGPEQAPAEILAAQRVPMPGDAAQVDPTVPDVERISQEELEKMTDDELEMALAGLSADQDVRRSRIEKYKKEIRRKRGEEVDTDTDTEADVPIETESDVDAEAAAAADVETEVDAETEAKPKVEPETPAAARAPQTSRARPEGSLLEKIKSRYRFVNPVPRGAMNLRERFYRIGGTNKKTIWGRVNYNSEGTPGTSSRVVVPEGHTEGGRGFGAAELDQWNSVIAEQAGPYNTWEELLEGFFRALTPTISNQTVKNIYSTNLDPGRISFIWNDPSFANPVTVVLDINPETNEYYVVAARPSRLFVQPAGSTRSRAAEPRWGPEVSSDAMVAFMGKNEDVKLTPSEKKKIGLTESSSDQSPAQRDLTKNLLPKTVNDGRTLWAKLSDYDWWSSGFGGKVDRQYRIDKYRARYLDKYQRVLRTEMERANAEGRKWVEQLAHTSAHAAMMNRERAGSFWQAMRDIGIPIHHGGATVVGGWKRDLRKGSKTYNEYIPGKDGNRVFDEKGQELSNVALVQGLRPGDFVLDQNGEKKYNGDFIQYDNLYRDKDGKPLYGGIETILREVADGEGRNLLDEVFMFLRAKRGSRLNNEGKRVPYTPEEIQAGLDLVKLHPEILIVAENYQRWNNGLVDFAIDAGYMTREAGEAYKAHGDYIPFFVEIDGETTDVGNAVAATLGGDMVLGVKGGLGSVRSLKKYKGHEKELMDPLEAITKNSFAILESSLINIASERALDDAVYLGTAIHMPDYNPKYHADSNNIVRSYRNGVLEHYMVTDPLLHEVLVSTLQGQHPYTGWLAKPARWTRELVTRGPEFMVANMLRDSLSVWITNQGDFRPVVDTFKTFATNVKGMRKGKTTKQYKELKAAGITGRHAKMMTGRGAGIRDGATGDFLSRGGLEESQFLKFSDSAVPYAGAIKKAWDLLGEVSEFSETATRENVYGSVYEKTKKRLIEEGVDTQTAHIQAMAEGAHQAAEILNFNRSGNSPWFKLITSIVPFMNARLQGTDQIARNFGGFTALRADQSDVRTEMIRRGLLLSAASAMLTVLNYEDEDYQNMPTWMQDDYFLIPLPSGKVPYLGIPIPFEAGVIFKLIPEQITKQALGANDIGQTIEALVRSLSTTLSLNPLQAPAARAPVEMLTNYNMFTRKQMVPTFMEGLGGQAKRPTTGALAQVVGGAMDVSPIKLDNLFRTVLPGVGSVGLGWLNWATEAVSDVPSQPSKKWTDYYGVKRFLKDEFEGGLRQALFEVTNAGQTLEKKMKSVEGEDPMKAMKMRLDNRKLLSVYPMAEDIRKRYMEVSNRKKALIRSSMSPGAKRDLMEVYDRQENALLANIKMIRRMAGPDLFEWKDIFF